MDCTFRTENGVFNYRVGAIILDGTRVLMTKSEGCGYYYSVGGRVKLGETAEQAVLREVFEETGVHTEIKRLGFVHENFFTSDFGLNCGLRYHELSLFYYIKPFDYSLIKSCGVNDAGQSETLGWIDLKDCGGVKFFPEFFRTELLNPSENVRNIITIQ